MSMSSLITQAEMAGVSAQIQAFLASLTNSQADLLTRYNSLLASLNAHIAQRYDKAHGGIVVTAGPYLTASGVNAGDVRIQMKINGVTVYVPASYRPGGVCHGDCHSDCHSNCHSDSCM